MQQTPEDKWIKPALAAKLIGVNRSTLSRQIADGSVRSKDGKVRLMDVRADRAANIRVGSSRNKSVAQSALQQTDATAIEAAEGETIGQAAERLVPALLTQFETKADAERYKETYLALLKKLEYDEKSREVVKVSAVAQIVGADYAKVRSKLMEIPSSVAPMAVLMKTPEEVRALIEKAITHALEELAYVSA